MRPKQRPTSYAAAALLWIILNAGPAHGQLAGRYVPATVVGQARPSVALLVVPTSDAHGDEVARFRWSAAQALDRAGRFELVSPTYALDPGNARARQLRVDEGIALLNHAQGAYNDLDTARSLSGADQAIKAFTDSDLTAHWKEFTAAWVLKIASLVANEAPRAAQEEIAQLLAVDPSIQFSPNFFPPEIISSAERTRQQSSKGAETLEIRTVPSGAEIYLDARFKGISPLKIEALAAGAHYVTAKAPGFSVVQQKVPTGAVEIDLRPAEYSSQYVAALDRIARNPDRKARDEAAREYGTLIGADQVVLVIFDAKASPTQVRLVGLRLDPKDGHNLAYKAQEFPLDRVVASADAFVAELIGTDDARRGGPVTHYGQEFFSGGIRRPAGLGLLGLSVVAAGLGAMFGAQANDTNATWRSTPQTDPSSASLETRFKRQAVMANVGFLGALLLAGGGGYLTFTGGPSDETPRAPVVPGPTLSSLQDSQ
ncbi:MAG TPA: PEGA domain-containing protein [Myxococcaceae bacterium]|nr:PEGA domain-containing protein [Myxococcaceae bacterium]